MARAGPVRGGLRLGAVRPSTALGAGISRSRDGRPAGERCRAGRRCGRPGRSGRPVAPARFVSLPAGRSGPGRSPVVTRGGQARARSPNRPPLNTPGPARPGRARSGGRPWRNLGDDQAECYTTWFDDARRLRTLVAELKRLSCEPPTRPQGWEVPRRTRFAPPDARTGRSYGFQDSEHLIALALLDRGAYGPAAPRAAQTCARPRNGAEGQNNSTTRSAVPAYVINHERPMPKRSSR